MLATQNPIEQEGTYPLPEAQHDRFMFKVFVNYPSYDEEFRIAETTTADLNGHVEPVQAGPDILRLQHIVRRMPIAPFVIHYALRLVRATRVAEGGTPAFVNEWVSWGAGPRGVQYLLLGGKARAGWRDGCSSRSTTSGPWPGQCCGIGSSPILTPNRAAFRPTK